MVRSDKVWPKLIGFLFGIRVKDTSEVSTVVQFCTHSEVNIHTYCSFPLQRSESQTRFSVLSRLTSRGATWNKAKTGSISSKSSRRFTSSSIVGIEGSIFLMFMLSCICSCCSYTGRMTSFVTIFGSVCVWPSACVAYVQ